ncbi:MAG: bifunctional aspartate kinase/homoserine dehydrogenase I [Spirochaetia bacterium]|nr:bifunctional aspartate kinase/homoserine dehydrogenase I [Spirochaetia bacterium]
MRQIQLHAIEGSMILSQSGKEKLQKLYGLADGERLVLVISSQQEKLLSIRSLVEGAKEHDERLWSNIEKGQLFWLGLVDQLLQGEGRKQTADLVKKGFTHLEELLRSAWLVGDISSGTFGYLDHVVGSWIAKMAGFMLAEVCDDVVLCEMDKALTMPAEDVPSVLVVSSPCHEGWQAFDAEAVASSLCIQYDAHTMTCWNSISLVRTADLNEVPSAQVIPLLSYSEATELSYFGSSVIHPKALLPAISKGYEVNLRCWNDFEEPGTVVTPNEDPKGSGTIKGFSVIHNTSLVNIEGAGLSGVIGFSARLFAAMTQAGISVILYSQASSEYSICLAVPSQQAEKAVETAKSCFHEELEDNRVHAIEAKDGLAIIAAVGNQMAGKSGVSGLFFSSLGKAGVNVMAIAQGSSERNISAVIKGKDCTKALRGLHASFFLSRQALSVGLIGPGNIGGTLLDQIAKEKVRLNEQFGLDIRIRAIANSRKMLLDDEGIDLDNWRQEFEERSVDCDLTAFETHVSVTYFPHSAIIDCSSSSFLAGRYVAWLKMGMHVITPNKKAGTADYAYYRQLFDTCRDTGRRFLYETTVGAGLPVLGTLKDLVQTGDNIRKIEGIVSGTLAWLFNNFDGSKPFSALVREAKQLGYTEPDPRDDLSGMDVARKTVILARELGYDVEVSQVPIESLVPKELAALPADLFLSRLDELDGPMLERFRQAGNEGKRLCYVGQVDAGGSCSVALKAYPADHPFSQASGTDNVICFTTDRYLDQPLVIKGPGAGREVTAGGVFSDILRLSAYLGARI